MSYFGLNRFITAWKIVQHHGGIFKAIKKLARMDALKIGKCMGSDKYGNRYYYNPYYFVCRSRWVEYPDYVHLNYDGSMISPEWYGWMHYKTDLPPNLDPTRVKYKWMADHSPNWSGTSEAYMPYSTVPPKIKAWTGN